MSRFFTLAPVFAAVLAGLAPVVAAQDGLRREISGALRYDAEDALPPRARMRVEARGAFDTLLGEAVFSTDSRQVPIPFALSVPADLSGELRAVIRRKGKSRWLVEGIPFPAGTDDIDMGKITLQAVTPLSFATHFDCGGTKVAFGILNDRAVMRVRGRDIALQPQEADRGARYVATDEDETNLWTKGHTATVTVDGAALPECTKTDPDAPIPYIAEGTAPSWSVTVRKDTMQVTTKDGRISHIVARPEVQVMPGAYRFEMAGIGAELTLRDHLCHSATGMPHPHAAELLAGAATLTGCGGDPARLLTGGLWHITKVAGEPVVADSRPTIAFDETDRVGGRTGCNVFSGSYELDADGVTFGRMVSTMMACPDAVMTQERRILDALERAGRFDIDASGALHLIEGDRTLLVARRQ